VLLLTPLVTFYPIVFGGYTLNHNDAGIDPSRHYGHFAVVPVWDPAGSGLGDEPFLFNLRRELARGHVPLLNMKNGMGASSSESLVTGTSYIFNPLLLLLPAGKPFSYDLFQLFHVYVLLAGVYSLLRN
jgi:hypothetical protein